MYGINPQPLFLGIDYDSKSVESMNPALDDTCMNGTPTEPAKSWYDCIKYERASGVGYTTEPDQAAWGKIKSNDWAFPLCSSSVSYTHQTLPTTPYV